MKINYIKTIILASAMSLMCSCVGDLDVMPLDPNVMTSEDAYSTPEGYIQGLKKIYSVWALSGQDNAGASDLEGMDAGNTVLLRCWWTLQENTTDEAKCAWGDSWVSQVNGMIWNTAEVEPMEGLYHRAMYIVSLVNDYLEQLPNAPEGVDRERYNAEARFCRALAYYVLMDAFGNPPFATEETGSSLPEQIKRADLFDWIEGELNTIKSSLPEMTDEYGRADQHCVDFLLARMYLNSEVYTGTKRYTDCITACNNIITSNSYELADDYAELFMADNGENADARKEIIFPVIADGNTTQSYGIGAIILGSRSGSEGTVENYGCNGGWDGFRATGNLVRAFNYDAEESAWTADNINSFDNRAIFYSEGRSLDITTSAIGTFTEEGWAVYKYSNLNSDGTPGKNTTFPDTDFPLFRLGEVYLMYAEAVARGGEGGSTSKAVEYIQNLRKRANTAYSEVTESWLAENTSVSGSTASVAYGNILNERCRELYWEATRRTDLIRFGLFTSNSYTWSEKGGVISGVGVDNKYNLFPIPVSDISVNGNLHQNEGY
ncbi:RagB/SusD family nutrient uptake outer membrane protein [Bacteroides caecigallinarum]|uniref:RagB/SusD family nutrient uptake outer membrane protein n=1 Tax=Bacteroides caecigallinarum TaxID=1411144 RepID=UPI00195B8703|nr:RagB/SusD family nutrient uptake outer membrane protein [Bacteroides caecigallinarum]MBM6864712.1 RagB/SusD family nutrient uptake outer membrane protein [Bacteroides caecigallinarum]